MRWCAEIDVSELYQNVNHNVTFDQLQKDINMIRKNLRKDHGRYAAFIRWKNTEKCMFLGGAIAEWKNRLKQLEAEKNTLIEKEEVTEQHLREIVNFYKLINGAENSLTTRSQKYKEDQYKEEIKNLRLQLMNEASKLLVKISCYHDGLKNKMINYYAKDPFEFCCSAIFLIASNSFCIISNCLLSCNISA